MTSSPSAVRSVTAATLLDAWDAAAARPAPLRGVTLLAAVWPERSADEWASVPLGMRDNTLLRFREAVFGGVLESVAECPSCGEQLEVRTRTADVQARYAEEGTVERQVGSQRLRLRPPSQADLTVALAAENPHRALLERCVESALELSDETAALVIDVLAELDPQADVQIGVTCSRCQEAHEMGFDIAAHLWGDLNDWARGTLIEVHRLAFAYGWREEDILAMSALRRHTYLGMIGA
jgi:hypothetical protein